MPLTLLLHAFSFLWFWIFTLFPLIHLFRPVPLVMKHKTHSLSPTRRLKLLLLCLILLLALLCLYYGSSLAPSSRRSDAEDSFGSDPVLGAVGVSRDVGHLHELPELNLEVPGSIPVSITSLNSCFCNFGEVEPWKCASLLESVFLLCFVLSWNVCFFMPFQICDERYSELIPCLDRNLIYQLKLKLNLSLMEHYERHCPPPERRYNCLIPPPTGYKVGYL